MRKFLILGALVATKTNPIDGKVMVRIPAGEFLMGTSAQELSDLTAPFEFQAGLFRDESPQQTVSLAEFYIDQTPVSNAEYKKFLDANPN